MSLLYSEKNLSNPSKETFRGIFQPLACKVLYLWYLIRNVGPWIIRVGDVWQKENKLSNAHKLLCQEIHLSGKGLFNGSYFAKVKKQNACLPYFNQSIYELEFENSLYSDNKFSNSSIFLAL